MSQNNKHIDKAFKDKLMMAEVSPPAAAWNVIESALLQKKKLALYAIYRRVGAAAAILVLVLMSVYFISKDEIESPTFYSLSKQLPFDTVNNMEEKGLSEKHETEFYITNRDLQQSIDKVEEVVSLNKSVFAELKESLALQEVTPVRSIEENSISGELISIASLESKHLLNDLSSLYNFKTNPLKEIKQELIKRRMESIELENYLAELNSKSANKGWSVGLAFSPTSVGRYSGLSNLDNGLVYADAGEGLSQVSNAATGKDLPAYSGGLSVEYQLSERWSLQSGLYYLKQGQQIDNFGVLQNDLNASNTSNSYFGNISFDNIEILTNNSELADFVQVTDEVSLSYFNGDLTQQFDLLEIPLLISYKIINRKTVLAFITGINPSILVGNRVYLSNNGSPIGKTDAVNTMIYKSVFGFSFEYPLSRRLYFNLSPAVKYQLNNFNKNAISNENLQYFEFKTGLNYRF